MHSSAASIVLHGRRHDFDDVSGGAKRWVEQVGKNFVTVVSASELVGGPNLVLPSTPFTVCLSLPGLGRMSHKMAASTNCKCNFDYDRLQYV